MSTRTFAIGLVCLVAIAACQTLPLGGGLAPAESSAAQVMGVGFTILKNEPFTLLSGQPAWLLAYEARQSPYMTVQISLVRRGVFHSLTANGSTLTDTYDYDYLLGVCRTLCAE